jgi:hypothetical protein
MGLAKGRTHHVLVRRIGRHVAQVLGDGPPGHRQAIAVEQAGVEQHLHQRRQAADAREVGHAVLSGGPEIGEDRDLLPDAGEIVEREPHPGGVRHGQQVEHGVG